MLLNLHVKNFALIDEIDIDFDKGLNILTGETGAGKSIILGSLNIALGAKADKDSIRTGCDYALVEITFQADNEAINNKLSEYDIVPENKEVLIQRKIMPNRSVFKVNGESLNVSAVRDIASVLMDVYGQHDYQNLLNSKKHIEILDSYASEDYEKNIRDYKEEFSRFNKLKELVSSPQIDEVKREREISLLEYQINEINAASLVSGEEEEVRDRLKVLENSSKIQNSLANVRGLTYDNNGSASELIDAALKELSGISSFDEKLSSLADELSNISDLISDFERELSDLNDEYDLDEEQLDILRNRYELINELERKYGRDIEEVLKYRDEKSIELNDLLEYETKRNEILKEFESLRETLTKKADKITSLRKKTAVKFDRNIIENLSDLNFNQSEFKTSFAKTDDFTSNGTDKVNFEISVNPGEPLKPLDSVSSGGELSRIMLAIKTVCAVKDDTDTLIFDEIDAGISGVTAWKVAKKLADLSVNHQIICITHLQQIASMADIHFEIKKVSDGNRTSTFINKLDDEGQIKEIARMLGDEYDSDKFKENATEIKKQADDYKKARV
ncbi:MAG: DNA repair protein RecN [Lachnospiraceae bacterium]|nr:DNA repair protein RecN [Lachnospiraceae bacterium]